MDITSCVSLARPLVTYSCQRLAALYELEQRLSKFQPVKPSLSSTAEPEASSSSSSSAVKMEAGNDDESVFTEPPSAKHSKKEDKAVKQEPKSEAKAERRGSFSSAKDRKPSLAGGAELPVITESNMDTAPPPPSFFHWCSHHSTLMLQLSCIIQLAALRCPAAFVQTRTFSGRGGARESGKGVTPPLAYLSMSLAEMPTPNSMSPELQKKVMLYGA